MEAEPESRPPGRQKIYGVLIALILVAMIALAAWAWWIPYGYFDPLVAQIRHWMFWKRG